jgi:hypothetical protein
MKRFRSEVITPVLLGLVQAPIRHWPSAALARSQHKRQTLQPQPQSPKSGTLIYLGKLVYRGDYIRMRMDLWA